MNRAYRVKWNASTGECVVLSELASCLSKCMSGFKGRCLVGLLTLSLGVGAEPFPSTGTLDHPETYESATPVTVETFTNALKDGDTATLEVSLHAGSGVSQGGTVIFRKPVDFSKPVEFLRGSWVLQGHLSATAGLKGKVDIEAKSGTVTTLGGEASTDMVRFHVDDLVVTSSGWVLPSDTKITGNITLANPSQLVVGKTQDEQRWGKKIEGGTVVVSEGGCLVLESPTPNNPVNSAFVVGGMDAKEKATLKVINRDVEKALTIRPQGRVEWLPTSGTTIYTDSIENKSGFMLTAGEGITHIKGFYSQTGQKGATSPQLLLKGKTIFEGTATIEAGLVEMGDLQDEHKDVTVRGSMTVGDDVQTTIHRLRVENGSALNVTNPTFVDGVLRARGKKTIVELNPTGDRVVNVEHAREIEAKDGATVKLKKVSGGLIGGSVTATGTSSLVQVTESAHVVHTGPVYVRDNAIYRAQSHALTMNEALDINHGTAELYFYDAITLQKGLVAQADSLVKLSGKVESLAPITVSDSSVIATSEVNTEGLALGPGTNWKSEALHVKGNVTTQGTQDKPVTITAYTQPNRVGGPDFRVEGDVYIGKHTTIDHVNLPSPIESGWAKYYAKPWVIDWRGKTTVEGDVNLGSTGGKFGNQIEVKGGRFLSSVELEMRGEKPSLSVDNGTLDMRTVTIPNKSYQDPISFGEIKATGKSTLNVIPARAHIDHLEVSGESVGTIRGDMTVKDLKTSGTSSLQVTAFNALTVENKAEVTDGATLEVIPSPFGKDPLTVSGNWQVTGAKATFGDGAHPLTIAGSVAATGTDNHETTVDMKGDTTIHADIRASQGANVAVKDGAVTIGKATDSDKLPVLQADNAGTIVLDTGDKALHIEADAIVSRGDGDKQQANIVIKSSSDGASLHIPMNGHVHAANTGTVSIALTGKKTDVSGVFDVASNGVLELTLGQPGDDGIATFTPFSGSSISKLSGHVRLVPSNTGKVAVLVKAVDPNATVVFPKNAAGHTPIVFLERVVGSVVFKLPDLVNDEIPSVYFDEKPDEDFLIRNSPPGERLVAIEEAIPFPDGTVHTYYHLVVLRPSEALEGWLEGGYATMTQPWQAIPRADVPRGAWGELKHSDFAMRSHAGVKIRLEDAKVGYDTTVMLGQTPLIVGGFVEGMHTRFKRPEMRAPGTFFGGTLYGVMPVGQSSFVASQVALKTLQTTLQNEHWHGQHRFYALAASGEARTTWQWGNWRIEPDVEVALTYMPSATLAMKRGQSVTPFGMKMASMTSLITKAGMKVQTSLMVSGVPLSLWGRVDFYHEWLATQRIEIPKLAIQNRGSWVTGEAGVSMTSGPWVWGLDLGTTVGKRRRGWMGRMNVNYAF